MTCCGRLFQTRAAATGKAPSPTVESRVLRTISDEDEAERNRCRASRSAGRQSVSMRYTAVPAHVYEHGEFEVNPVHEPSANGVDEEPE